MTAERRIPLQTLLRCKYLRLRGPAEAPLPVPRQTLNLFWARNGICLGLRELGVVPGAIVLVPSFACRSVPEAVAASGAAVEFYRVDPRGRVDLEDLRKRIRAGVRGVLAIHYFSCLQPHIAEVRDLCVKHGLWLIEDSAHVLPAGLRPEGAGAFGDISVFSWRKFLPVYDGGGLLMHAGPGKTRRSALARQAGMELRAAKDVVDRWRSIGRARTIRSEPQSDAEQESAMRRPGTARDPNSDAFDPQLVNLPMSRVSEWIFRHSDLEEIVTTRRRNWQHLHDSVLRMPYVKPWSGEPPAGHGPWAYALTFPAVNDAHRALRGQGIPAATWEGVRPASLMRNHFPESERLYRDLVFLPVHQDLSSQDIEFIADAMRRASLPGRGPGY